MRKMLAAYRLLKDEGIRSFARIVYSRVRLKLSIAARGRSKTVSLDGCQFQLRGLPDTYMKLELLTGGYEQPERRAVRRYIRAEWPVIELGGCFGVVACITNRLLTNPKAHVVVEPNPSVIPYLRSNREANRCSFKVDNRALAYDEPSVTFRPSLDFWGSSLHHDGGQQPVSVPATRLSQILREEGFERFALICDIEGQEYELVMREAETLRQAHVIIMEIHPHIIGEERVQVLMSRLATLGFKLLDQSAFVVVFGT